MVYELHFSKAVKRSIISLGHIAVSKDTFLDISLKYHNKLCRCFLIIDIIVNEFLKRGNSGS